MLAIYAQREARASPAISGKQIPDRSDDALRLAPAIFLRLGATKAGNFAKPQLVPIAIRVGRLLSLELGAQHVLRVVTMIPDQLARLIARAALHVDVRPFGVENHLRFQAAPSGTICISEATR
jgi:hypothetical protein